MNKSIFTALILTMTVAGCGSIRDSRANPFNWFGNDRGSAPAPVEENTNPLIPQQTGLFEASRKERERYKGTPIAALTDLRLERVPGGVLVRATGLAATQGVYDARLTPENKDVLPVDGVLTFFLEAQDNTAITTQGTQQTREVTVAVRLTEQELAGARVIQVKSVQNTLQARR